MGTSTFKHLKTLYSDSFLEILAPTPCSSRFLGHYGPGPFIIWIFLVKFAPGSYLKYTLLHDMFTISSWSNMLFKYGHADSIEHI